MGPPREEVDKYLFTFAVARCILLLLSSSGRGFGRGPMDDGPPAEVVGIHLLHIKRLTYSY